jgi:AraC-like DNA-binding protein
MYASASAAQQTFGQYATVSAAATLSVTERDSDAPGIAIPGPQAQLVVRFGPAAQKGLDLYAFGARQTVGRKLLHRGQRIVTARLELGTTEAVLGAPASAIVGRAVALEDLWGDAAAGRLRDRLAQARDMSDAARTVQSAIAERVVAAGRAARARLVLEAASRLTSASVSSVALDLGVSERHLRRAFHEITGMSPKAFAKLTRFRRALGIAREPDSAGWATIAAAAGYYDQAHLIAEFRTIAGVTPRAFLGELGSAQAIG